MAQPSARELALMVLNAVDTRGAYANIALFEIMDKYRPAGHERAFLTELSYGTLRRLNTIDWILSKFIQKPLNRQNPWIRNILRLAVYQILYLERIPEAAACNEAVKLAKKYAQPWAADFVNAVLRRVVREKKDIRFPDIENSPVDHIALSYSHPPWLVAAWLKEFGIDETIRICQANNQAPATTIRTNLLRTTRKELLGLLEKEAKVTASATPYAPEGITVQGFQDLQSLRAFKDGLFFVQDESSMLAAHALRPSPGSFVLDVCGGPGGKATHIAELTGDKCRIIVLDIHAHRLALVDENCKRLGIKSIETLRYDARDSHTLFSKAADYVLVDAPCSGLGVLRRKPDSRWRKQPEQIPALITLQRQILSSASACVCPGGVLLYTTCSIGSSENLEQIKHFTRQNREFVLEDLRPFLPPELDLKRTLELGYIQLMPYQELDGFFIARLRRKGLSS
ncbi:MAG: 16S rRNA (cytosine(967)-C(5))-methyltransferase RsmB [Bacillota bacterium]